MLMSCHTRVPPMSATRHPPLDPPHEAAGLRAQLAERNAELRGAGNVAGRPGPGRRRRGRLRRRGQDHLCQRRGLPAGGPRPDGHGPSKPRWHPGARSTMPTAARCRPRNPRCGTFSAAKCAGPGNLRAGQRRQPHRHPGRARPLCDADGHVIGAVTTMTDVSRRQTRRRVPGRTERTGAGEGQEEIAAQNEELRSMVESLARRGRDRRAERGTRRDRGGRD